MPRRSSIGVSPLTASASIPSSSEGRGHHVRQLDRRREDDCLPPSGMLAVGFDRVPWRVGGNQHVARLAIDEISVARM